ncbi:hypothetical protein [Pseudomonas faucium]|uniref:hypothetical protein n=1 Tax=Pseudomonas faucium TaxID=2740518 RepID=UPI001F4102E4|nr:hypothetical protein [Pseudomonas faucium]
MANKTGDFSADVARYKAMADERLARLIGSARYHSFLTNEAIDAFAKIEDSAYAGRSLKAAKPSDV